ncbi:MAG: hypothetical protein ACHP8B_15880 [Terriglobales bacterium]
MAKLNSVPPYPSMVIANGLPTKFVRNVTPDGKFQIASVKAENDFEVLYEGISREDGEEILRQKVEEEYPGLMNQA